MLEEKTNGTIEEGAEKITEETGEKIEEIREEVEQMEEKIVKKSKLEIAKEKIEQAKAMTAKSKAEIEEYLNSISEDIDKLNIKKEALFTSALLPAERLMNKIGIGEETLSELPQSQIELVDPEKESLRIKDISSGRFKGFFFALLAGLASLLGWCYVVSKALGLSIPPEKIPDFDRMNKMFEWTSGQLGQGANANIGAAAVIIAILLIMWIVYALIVSVRASNNIKTATKTEEAVNHYYDSQEEHKDNMRLVKEHIQNSSKTLDKYKVLLEEQNAKINRALFLEEAEDFEGLHSRTKEDIGIAQNMITELKKLLAAPISKEGVLTTEAVETLNKASKSINDRIMEIYN